MLSFRFQTATFLLVVLLVLASGRETQKRNTVLRREPNKIKRPWLSIIKNLLKHRYKFKSVDYRMIENGVEIRTHKYIFIGI